MRLSPNTGLGSNARPDQPEAHALRCSGLTLARDVPGFSLADAGPDVRGWHVIASDRVSVGVVSRLIVQMRSGAIRYLMIELGPALERRARRVFTSSVLVPVGLVHRVDDLCTILLQGISSETLRTVPRIPNRPITRLDEQETLERLGLPPLADSDTRLYDAPHFSSDTLLHRAR
jgi:hypothetical protein